MTKLVETPNKAMVTARAAMAIEKHVKSYKPSKPPIETEPGEQAVKSLKFYRSAIRSTMAHIADYSVELGGVLNGAKKELPHGTWIDLLDEFGIPSRHAQRLIRVWKKFGSQWIGYIPDDMMTAEKLCKLPDETIAGLIEDKRLTREITRAQAEEIIGAPAERPPREPKSALDKIRAAIAKLTEGERGELLAELEREYQ